MLDSELTFSHHINLIARKCYYQPRQLRVVSRSLTHQSRLTLVHTFVTSRIDCCCFLLAGLPLGTLARWTEFCVWLPVLLGGCPSFLPSLPTCVMYSIGCLYLRGYSIVSLQWSPVVSLAAPPSYLCDLCCPVSVLAARRVLRSAARGEFLVPRARLAIMQRRAF